MRRPPQIFSHRIEAKESKVEKTWFLPSELKMVRLEKVARVYVLTLVGDGEHRFTAAYIEKILSALEKVKEDKDVGALVTTNEGKYYSTGLDLDWVRGPQRENIGSLLGRLFATMLTMNVPTVAAICGHACAAGFLFALSHDHRFMKSDRGYVYMSELDVAVMFSIPSLNLIRAMLSPKAFKDAILTAKKHTAEEARDAGMIDFVHENAAETVEAAVKFANELSSRNWSRDMYCAMRLAMWPGLVESLLNLELWGYPTHRSKI